MSEPIYIVQLEQGWFIGQEENKYVQTRPIQYAMKFKTRRAAREALRKIKTFPEDFPTAFIKTLD